MTKPFKIEVCIGEEMIEKFTKMVVERGGRVPDEEELKDFFESDVAGVYEQEWESGLEDAVDCYLPGLLEN